MALIGAAFGLGFTFGPLFGFLAVPSGTGDPGPGPGYAAAGLSAVALVLAWFKLPESLQPGSKAQKPHWFDTQALARRAGHAGDWAAAVDDLHLRVFVRQSGVDACR